MAAKLQGKAEQFASDIQAKVQAADDAVAALPRYPGTGEGPDVCRVGPGGDLELYDGTGATVLVRLAPDVVRSLLPFLHEQYDVDIKAGGAVAEVAPPTA